MRNLIFNNRVGVKAYPLISKNMADSYSITYNTTKVKKDDLDLQNFRRTNDACFSSFNSEIKHYTKYVDLSLIHI